MTDKVTMTVAEIEAFAAARLEEAGTRAESAAALARAIAEAERDASPAMG